MSLLNRITTLERDVSLLKRSRTVRPSKYPLLGGDGSGSGSGGSGAGNAEWNGALATFTNAAPGNFIFSPGTHDLELNTSTYDKTGYVDLANNEFQSCE